MSMGNGQGATTTDEPEWRKELRAQQAKVISVFNRLNEIPPELLDKVLEAVITSTNVEWRPSDCARDHDSNHSWVEPSLEMGLYDFFKWPPTIEPATLQMLNQRAAPILLKKAILELPARFTIQNSTMVLDVPKAIRGNEHGVRYLVFDVLVSSRKSYQAELNMMIAHMGDINALFPRLRSCVICINFTGSFSTPSLFDAQALSCDNRTGYNQTETLRVSLCKLISTFHTSGPGVHKFIRCGQELGKAFNSCRFGPFVNITSVAATMSGELTNEIGTTHTDTRSSFAEQVLQRAYCYYRDGTERVDVV